MNEATLHGLLDELNKIKEASGLMSTIGGHLAGIGGALRGGAQAGHSLIQGMRSGGSALVRAGTSPSVPKILGGAVREGFQAAKAAPSLSNQLLGGGALAAGAYGVHKGIQGLSGGQ